jgi:hypothetical protein
MMTAEATKVKCAATSAMIARATKPTQDDCRSNQHIHTGKPAFLHRRQNKKNTLLRGAQTETQTNRTRNSLSQLQATPQGSATCNPQPSTGQPDPPSATLPGEISHPRFGREHRQRDRQTEHATLFHGCRQHHRAVQHATPLIRENKQKAPLHRTWTQTTGETA